MPQIPKFEPGKPLYIRGVVQQTGTAGDAIPSFVEPDFKRQWAKKHLELLKSEIERFNQDNPYRVLPEEDTNTGEYVITIVHPDILAATSVLLILGDFVASLRSSLDYLAWQLVLASGGTPTRETHFPICDKNSSDTQVKIAKATFGMNDHAILVVKSLQPYQYGDAFKTSYLWRLNTLWNIDKHRHLSALAIYPNWQICLRSGFDGQTPRGEQIENRTIFRLPLSIKNEIEFNPERQAELRFYDRREEIEFRYEDFVEMYDFIANDVIPAFTGFFAQPKP
jgi:hypothetical protein